MKNTLNVSDMLGMFSEISSQMHDNKERLNQQDAVYGNGQLGSRMAGGFGSVPQGLATAQHADIGGMMGMAGSLLGQNTNSALGGLLSSGLGGFGDATRGKKELDLPGLIQGVSGLVACIPVKL